MNFEYQTASHPAVGGDDYAGVVGQLEELPPDMPLFKNWVSFLFNLYCKVELEYFDNYSWQYYSNEVELEPGDVAGLPGAFGVDTNGDGVQNAFGGGTTILRMDDAGSTSNPQYAHSWSWGSVFYWSSREGQGAISWPE